jgi:hypothetical protein
MDRAESVTELILELVCTDRPELRAVPLLAIVNVSPRMPVERKKSARPPAQQAPEAAFTPRVHRTDPVVEDSDVVILRTAVGAKNGSQTIFQVHVGAAGPLPDRFMLFEHAAVKGDEAARAFRVRLFYLDSPHDPPFLVRDYRVS